MSVVMGDERAEVASRRANVYNLLAMLYIKEPTAELIEQLNHPELTESLERLGIQFDPFFAERDSSAVAEELLLEYTRLHLGPGHIPTYESVFRGAVKDGERIRWGLMYGESTAEVEKEYQRHGYTIIPGYKGAPDHIAAELYLMRLLAQEEAEAWEAGDHGRAQRLRTDQRNFLDQHLLVWAPRFFELTAQRAQLAFYRTLASLTSGFLESEFAALSGEETGL